MAEQAAKPASEAAVKERRFDAIESLKDPHFRLYFVTNGFFLFAQFFTQLSNQWLIVNLTSSRTLLGLVSTIQGGTGFLISPFGGAIADLLPRRHILTVARVTLATAALVLSLLVFTDAIAVWHVMVAALVAGAVMAFSQAATQTYVFDIVGPKLLRNALALNQSITSAFQMAGPTMGGFIIAFGGVALSYLLAGGIYAGGLALLLMIPVLGIPVVRSGAKTSLWKDALEGLRYARRDKVAMWLIGVTGFTFLTAGQQAFRPAFAKDVLEVGSSGLGLMTTMFAAGSIAGAFSVTTVLKNVKWVGYCLVAFLVLKDMAYLVFAFSRSFPLSLSMEALGGFAGPYVQITASTYLQTAAPPEMRGRAVSLLFMVFSLNAFGAILAGAIADATSLTFALAFGSITRTCLILLVLAIARPLRTMGREGPG